MSSNFEHVFCRGRLLKTISVGYLNIYEESKALEYLEKLAVIEKNNPESMLEVSEVCINLLYIHKCACIISSNKVSKVNKVK